jgi:hypothetical protein
MPKNAAPKTEKKTVAPSFKSFVKLCNSEDRPRGIKVAINSASSGGAFDGVTFTYGPKSDPVSVLATKEELAMLGLSLLGLKLP